MTNEELANYLAEIARGLASTTELLQANTKQLTDLSARLAAMQRDQIRHETDVLAHKPARAL